MRVDCQNKVQAIGELVRSGEYQVDPVAVAEAMVERIVWHDLPELAAAEPSRRRREHRLRGLVRVGQLVSAPMTPRAPAEA